MQPKFGQNLELWHKSWKYSLQKLGLGNKMKQSTVFLGQIYSLKLAPDISTQSFSTFRIYFLFVYLLILHNRLKSDVKSNITIPVIVLFGTKLKKSYLSLSSIYGACLALPNDDPRQLLRHPPHPQLKVPPLSGQPCSIVLLYFLPSLEITMAGPWGRWK